MRSPPFLAATLMLLGAGQAKAADGRAMAPFEAIQLPGAADGGLSLDYLASDLARGRIWVPAAGTGRVDVIDAATRKLTEVPGFATAEVERHGQKRKVGPSSASVGDGAVYVGTRGDSSVCAVDAKTLAVRVCTHLASMPDGVAFVAKVKEVWVTTPRDQAIVVLDASKPDALPVKTRIALDGEPEGYAVDETSGHFFTNLEDKDQTLTLDLATHLVLLSWKSDCGEGGPKGLAFDAAGKLLMLACPDRVKVLDAERGTLKATFETGPGLDNIDFLPSRRELFAAAGKAGVLTIARINLQGGAEVAAKVATAVGARNAVGTSDGTAFVADGPRGRILVLAHP